ncbi:MAG: hypothetical protein J7K32_00700 [Deltaproteobacteria bacterium]|nr:hypothetical protein [Deltaproteobacteria bacterium]
MRKSKPVLLAAGLIWGSIAYVYVNQGFTHTVEAAVRHNILEFSELFLFLLVAMTYINSLDIPCQVSSSGYPDSVSPDIDNVHFYRSRFKFSTINLGCLF